jgi:hypothetical protein
MKDKLLSGVIQELAWQGLKTNVIQGGQTTECGERNVVTYNAGKHDKTKAASLSMPELFKKVKPMPTVPSEWFHKGHAIWKITYRPLDHAQLALFSQPGHGLSYVSARQECCTVGYDKNFTYAVKKYRTCISTLATKFCGKIGFTLIKILTILRLLYNNQSSFSFISKPVSNQQTNPLPPKKM